MKNNKGRGEKNNSVVGRPNCFSPPDLCCFSYFWLVFCVDIYLYLVAMANLFPCFLISAIKGDSSLANDRVEYPTGSNRLSMPIVFLNKYWPSSISSFPKSGEITHKSISLSAFAFPLAYEPNKNASDISTSSPTAARYRAMIRSTSPVSNFFLIDLLSINIILSLL